MSHKLTLEQHSKIEKYLQDGTSIAVKGYSHVVCVRYNKAEEWLAKGYEIIEENSNAVVVGKKKEEKKEEVKA